MRPALPEVGISSPVDPSDTYEQKQNTALKSGGQSRYEQAETSSGSRTANSRIDKTMLLQRFILSWVFRLSGLSIGIPALGTFVYLGFAYITTSRVPEAQAQDIPNSGLIGLLMYGAHGMAFMFRTLLNLVRDAFAVVTIAAIFLALIGALLFWVGSGIDKAASWARLMAYIISIVFLVFWIGLTGMANGPVRMVSVGGIAASLWALWVLTWQYR